jgi:uncharacterized repeat protein (TIGR01451 family)
MKHIHHIPIALGLLFMSLVAKGQQSCDAAFVWLVNPNGVFQFIDSSYKAPGYSIVSWAWSFGDGTTSTVQNPTKTYTSPGSYTVCLKIVAANANNQSLCVDSVCQTVVWHCPNFISGQWNYTNNPGTSTVAFYANFNSSSPPLKYLWNFGNLDTSTQQNPVFTFPFAGAYNVCLKVTDSIGCYNTFCQSVIVPHSNQPCHLKAKYTHLFNGPTLVLTANDSFFPTGSVIINRWLIGNVQIASCIGPNCTATANTANLVDTQNVCLIARIDGTNCADTFCKQIVFGNPPACNIQGNFTYSFPTKSSIKVMASTTGGNPTGNIHKWYLNGIFLGQTVGNNSSQTYHLPSSVPNGQANICLKVEVPNATPPCTDSICKPVFICRANALFTYQILPGDTVQFNSAQGMNTYSHTWYLSNGTIFSTQPSPKIKFNVPINGLQVCHIVREIALSPVCADTFCTTLSSSVPCNLTANFSWIDSGLTVYFQSSQLNNTNVAHFWTFGDGNTSSLPNPIHTYASPGTYTVCLKVWLPSNPSCRDSVCKTIVVSNSGCGMTASISQTINHNNQIVLVANSTGGCFPKKYLWSTGDSSDYIILPNPPLNLTYSVTVTDCNGCTATAVKVIQPPATAKLCGTVFNDLNGNGIQDSLENGLRAYIVISGNGHQFTLFSDSITGAWSKNVPPGTYSICVYMFNSGTSQNWVPTIPLHPSLTPNQGVCYYNITVTANQTLCNLNFGFRNNRVRICGYVYVDLNGNHAKDAGEPGIAGQPVKIGTQTVYTNQLGYYVFNLPVGTYQVTYTPVAPYTGYSSHPPSYSVAATTAGQIYCGNDFGVQVPSGQCDVAVDVTPLCTVVPGFTAVYNIKLFNLHGVATGGLLTFNFEPGLLFQSAHPTPASFNNTNATVTWNVNSIAPGTYQSFNVRLNVPVGTPLGLPVFSFAEFTTNGTCTESNLANNIDTTHQTVVGSYDPNDKHVSPEGKIANVEQELVYTIRFQNTGTAPAVNVVIADTLSQYLNWNTFEVKNASHSYIIQREGQYVNFVFSNIMLPDSFSNEPESHGFISFKIKALPNLLPGTEINNRAAIYFDFNEPVITNTTVNIIDVELDIDNLNKEKIHVVAMPNPFKTTTNIWINGEINGAVEMVITDLAGRKVLSEISENRLITIQAGNLAPGLYLYELKYEHKTIGSGKLIAE